MSFFPCDLDLETTQSPEDILAEAKAEWDEKGKGIVSLLIDQRNSSADDKNIYFVYAQHIPSSRIAHILTVCHEKNQAYPASIEPQTRDVPRYLRRKYITPARPGGMSPSQALERLIAPIGQQIVVNDGICDSAAEFTEKLVKAFGSGSIKAQITNLIVGSTVVDEADEACENTEALSSTGEEQD
jgi:hypothetical protein